MFESADQTARSLVVAELVEQVELAEEKTEQEFGFDEQTERGQTVAADFAEQTDLRVGFVERTELLSDYPMVDY